MKDADNCSAYGATFTSAHNTWLLQPKYYSCNECEK